MRRLLAECRGLMVIGLACGAAQVQAASLRLVTSPDPSFASAAAGGDSGAPVLSRNGRYVLFASTANNLVLASAANHTPCPATLNVYVRDRTNGTTRLASISLAGNGGGGDSFPAGISDDGRYVLFESSASDLVPNDTNGVRDVFVRDLASNTTILVSVATSGVSGNGASYRAVIAPGGRYVAFASAATNLVLADTNGIPDVFVRDLQTATTILASPGATAYLSQPSSGKIGSDAPEITPNGRYVAFYSTATNLVPDARAVGEIFLRDIVEGTTYWVSSNAPAVLEPPSFSSNAVSYSHRLSANGRYVAFQVSSDSFGYATGRGVILRYDRKTGQTDIVHTNAYVPQARCETLCSLDLTPDGRFLAFVANTNLPAASTYVCRWDAQTATNLLVSLGLDGSLSARALCDWPRMDPSGRYVAFLSTATNLTTNVLAGGFHMFVRDTQAGNTQLVDRDRNGKGAGCDPASIPCLGDDGRLVAFQSSASNLAEADRNHCQDVFVRLLTTNTVELISARDSALPSRTPSGPSRMLGGSVSSDGRYLAFVSEADDLVADDTNQCSDVVILDLWLGTNWLVSVSSNGLRSANGLSTQPSLSADARYVAFTSWATNLVPGDANGAMDVFVRDRWTGSTVLVSVNVNGTGPGNADSYAPVISPDGRRVLFRSKASNLALGATAANGSLFLRDLRSAITWRLSSGASGSPVLYEAMTPDGRRVAFIEQTSGLNNTLFVWDSLSATRIYTNSGASLSCVAISANGRRVAYSASGNVLRVLDLATGAVRQLGNTLRSSPRFNSDGRFLAYATTTPSLPEVYLYDYETEAVQCVSHRLDSSAPANGRSDSPDITADGRLVAYRSDATDIVAGHTNGWPNILLYDRFTGLNSLLSATPSSGLSANHLSTAPFFSGDGRMVFFGSWASNLGAQDFNQAGDVAAFSLFCITILPGDLAGQGCWLSWPFDTGRTYRVEYKSNVSDGTWHSVVGSVSNSASSCVFHDPAPGLIRRFYRVVAF